MKDLMTEVANLKTENQSISSRLSCLQQQLMSKKEEVKDIVEIKDPKQQNKGS